VKITSLWRIARAPFADLRGEGARLYGGRWNPVGTPCVYASTTLSLAALETLVHTDPDLLPPDLLAMELESGGLSLEEHDDNDLPAHWRRELGQAETQAFGGRWSEEKRSALLVLPSVVLPADAGAAERNVVLNPLHPEAGSIRIVRQLPFTFDTRLVSERHQT
jgi:RES domain-containing protein